MICCVDIWRGRRATECPRWDTGRLTLGLTKEPDRGIGVCQRNTSSVEPRGHLCVTDAGNSICDASDGSNANQTFLGDHADSDSGGIVKGSQG